MQTVTNLLLDSTLAKAGGWRDINNFVGFSVHGINLEGNVWVELSNDPAIKINGSASILSPAAPTLSAINAPTTTGAVPTWGPTDAYGTFYVKLTYITPWGGETAAGSESHITIPAGEMLAVAPPGSDATGTAVGYNVYIGLTSGSEVLQTGKPWISAGSGIPVGEPWVMINGYQPSNLVPPSTSLAGGPNTGVLAFYLWKSGAGPADGSPASGAAEAGVFTDSNNGGQTIWAPSCLYFNWIRIVKDNSVQSKETKVWLFGANG